MSLSRTAAGALKMRTVRVRLGAPESYEIHVGPGALARLGETARAALRERARRVVVVSNETVFGLYGRLASSSLRASGFMVEAFLVGDGERHKTLRAAEHALDFFSRSRLERTDAVVALGGGVVGDLAGFAASVYLRGVGLIQVPTTLLAQIDASVGDPELFRRTRDFLAAHGPSPAESQEINSPRAGRGRVKLEAAGARADELARLIAGHCAFKARVVAADERESLEADGARARLSRRVLNFGHTVGHALEVVTRYRRFRHGEAVGHGMIVAAEISKRLGLLGSAGLQSIREAVALAGPLPPADDLAIRDILAAASSDKKSVGGQLHWVLLEGIGRARVVPAREVPGRVVREALGAGLRAGRGPSLNK